MKNDIIACADKRTEETMRKSMQDCGFKNNSIPHSAADAAAEQLCQAVQQSRIVVNTPLGYIVAEASVDSEHPGVQVSLHRNGEEYEPMLALVEYATIETDARTPALVTRVWRDTQRDEYTDQIVHTSLEKNNVLLPDDFRFTAEDVLHIMNRTGLDCEEVIRILTEWDRGIGDADDVTDAWENSEK